MSAKKVATTAVVRAGAYAELSAGRDLVRRTKPDTSLLDALSTAWEAADVLLGEADALQETDTAGALDRAEQALAGLVVAMGDAEQVGHNTLLYRLRYGEARAHLLRATLFRLLSRHEQALTAGATAQERYAALLHSPPPTTHRTETDRIEARRGLARSLREMAMIHRRRGTYTEGLALLNEEHRLLDAAGDEEELAHTLVQRAALLYHMSDISDALFLALKSLQIQEKYKDKDGIAAAANMASIIFMTRKDYARAITYQQRAVDLTNPEQAPQRYAGFLGNMAAYYNEAGNPETALRLQRDCLAIRLARGDHLGQSLSYLELGVLYSQQNEGRSALRYLRRALMLARHIGSATTQTVALLTLGKVFLRANKLRRAGRVLEECLAFSRQLGEHDHEAETHQLLSEWCEKRGEMSLALQHYHAFHRIQAALFSKESERQLHHAQTVYELERARAEAEAERNHSATLAEVVQQLRDSTEQLQRLATTDPLTGLYHRGHFTRLWEAAVGEWQKKPTPLTLAICDMDHFKEVNDTFGHPVGDLVIVRMARLLRDLLHSRTGLSEPTLREPLVARYGGEEFVFLLEGLEDEAARELCQWICQTVGNAFWDDLTPGKRMTLSIGIVHAHEIDFLPDTLTPVEHADRLLRRADERLYRAKQRGRNQVAWDMGLGTPATESTLENPLAPQQLLR